MWTGDAGGEAVFGTSKRENRLASRLTRPSSDSTESTTSILVQVTPSCSAPNRVAHRSRALTNALLYHRLVHPTIKALPSLLLVLLHLLLIALFPTTTPALEEWPRFRSRLRRRSGSRLAPSVEDERCPRLPHTCREQLCRPRVALVVPYIERSMLRCRVASSVERCRAGSDRGHSRALLSSSDCIERLDAIGPSDGCASC